MKKVDMLKRITDIELNQNKQSSIIRNLKKEIFDVTLQEIHTIKKSINKDSSEFNKKKNEIIEFLNNTLFIFKWALGIISLFIVVLGIFGFKEYADLKSFAEECINDVEAYVKDSTKQTFEPYIDTMKDNIAVSFNNLGILYTELGEIDEAFEAFENAIRTKHDYSLAYYNLACLYSRENKKEEALKKIIEFLEMNNDLTRADFENIVDFENIKQHSRFKKILDDFFPQDK